MADRSSAEIFSTLFEMLAKNPTDDNKKIAKEMNVEGMNYDFNGGQMKCDEDLIKLGIAKKAINEDYPEDGEVIMYLEEDY